MMRLTMFLALLLAACALAPDPDPDPVPAVPVPADKLLRQVMQRNQVGARELLEQPRPTQMLTADFAPPASNTDMRGRVRLLHGRSSCRSARRAQGNPMPLRSTVDPRAGEQVQLEWRTNPTAPYETGRPAMVLVWFDAAAPTDLSPWGFEGCLLWAPLDPSRIWTLVPDGAGLRQTGGEIRLAWTPPTDWAGRRVYCQAVVLSPGANSQGWLLSSPVEVWIGRRSS